MVPPVIYTKVYEGEDLKEQRKHVFHYNARLAEGEEARCCLVEYFIDDTPSGDGGSASRKDSEPFFLREGGRKCYAYIHRCFSYTAHYHHQLLLCTEWVRF